MRANCSDVVVVVVLVEVSELAQKFAARFLSLLLFSLAKLREFVLSAANERAESCNTCDC